MKLFFILTSSLFLCLGAQAKFPAEGLIKTASSGAIQGKAILMKAENAELVDSKLERIHSNKFIAGMAKGFRRQLENQCPQRRGIHS